MTQRVIVITGASSGIGAAAAELFARQGNSVVLVARRQPALDAVVARCGPSAFAVPADVSIRSGVQAVIGHSLKHFGHIDVWINNVGQGISRPPSELTDADIDAVMQVNVKSALYGMQEILPHFKERNAGHIINISSMLGRVPFAVIRSAYVGAKHFLNALTATMRDEVKATHPDIQISLVSPGVVRTDFGINALHGGPDSRELPNSQSAEEVADVIAWVVESRVADAYTRMGARDQVNSYFASVGLDPA